MLSLLWFVVTQPQLSLFCSECSIATVNESPLQFQLGNTIPKEILSYLPKSTPVPFATLTSARSSEYVHHFAENEQQLNERYVNSSSSFFCVSATSFGLQVNYISLAISLVP
jgi:hypothetical protein